MDRGAWWAAVHRVIKRQTLLSDFFLYIEFLFIHKKEERKTERKKETERETYSMKHE